MVEVDPAIAAIEGQQSLEPETTETHVAYGNVILSGLYRDGQLYNSYTLYAQNKSDGWDEKNIKALANFNTIGQFWGMYQHLKRPSQMPEGTTINLFLKGIKPVWEDPEHKEGASFRLQFSKGYANQIWEDLVLAFIGEQFTLPDEITGIVLSVGRTDKLSIWYRHGFDNRVAPQIKADMIRLLGLPADVKTSVSVFFPQNAPGGKPSNKRAHPQANEGGRSHHGRELQSYSSNKPAAAEAPTSSAQNDTNKAGGAQEATAGVSLDDLLE